MDEPWGYWVVGALSVALCVWAWLVGQFMDADLYEKRTHDDYGRDRTQQDR